LVRFKFANAGSAKRFVGWWNEKVRGLIDGNLTAKIMLGGIFDEIELEQDRRQVTLWGELERTQVEIILKTMASVVEKEQARIRARHRKRVQEKAKKKAEPRAPRAPSQP
jgi:hypothetical protein